MIIHNKSESLSLDIVDYQYPEHRSGEKGYDYDANWLMVAVSYSNDKTSEEYRDACLLTYEFEDFIKGFSNVLAGKETRYISEFMEPNLKFSIEIADNKILLSMEFCAANETALKSRKVSEVITKERAKEIVEELRLLFARFPQR